MCRAERARFLVEGFSVEVSDKVTVLCCEQNPAGLPRFALHRKFKKFRAFENRLSFGIRKGSCTFPLAEVFRVIKGNVAILPILGTVLGGWGGFRFGAAGAIKHGHDPLLFRRIVDDLGVTARVPDHRIFR